MAPPRVVRERLHEVHLALGHVLQRLRRHAIHACATLRTLTGALLLVALLAAALLADLLPGLRAVLALLPLLPAAIQLSLKLFEESL